MAQSVLVVAIGGNSLIKDPQHMSVPDQYRALGETSRNIAGIIKDGWHVAIGHGNGPQVGFIMRRSELARGELHEVPLDVCDADTQGAIGYELQQNLGNQFRELKVDRQPVSIVTQVEVAPDDPATTSVDEAVEATLKLITGAASVPSTTTTSTTPTSTLSPSGASSTTTSATG